MLSSLILRRISKFGKDDCQDMDKEKTELFSSRRISIIREDSKEEPAEDLQASERSENRKILAKRAVTVGCEDKKCEVNEMADKIKVDFAKIKNSGEKAFFTHGQSTKKTNNFLTENSAKSPSFMINEHPAMQTCSETKIFSGRPTQTRSIGEDKLNGHLAEDQIPTRKSQLRSRYSEGDLLRPVLKDSKNLQKKTSRNKRRNSTVSFQELRFPQAEEKPAIQCRGRRGAICEELEKITFFAGLSLRQWRKVILTNETLQNYEIRW